MPHNEFVHLHLHSQYSLLDGAIKFDKLAALLNEQGSRACAITDHGVMHGVVQFYQTMIDAGIKPIIGCEGYIAPRSRFERQAGRGSESAYHIVLLAQNSEGYRNLCRLVSKAYLEGFYYKPRMDKELLAQHSKGLICLSACLKGEISSLILADQFEAARAAADFYKQTFPDSFYIELMHNGIPEQEQANAELIKIAGELELPLVATNDCHYLRREHARHHDVLLCVQTGKTMQDEDRMRLSTPEFYVKSPQEMIKAFSDTPEAIRNTVQIAERCNVEMQFGNPIFPKFKAENGEPSVKVFERYCHQGLEQRLSEIERQAQGGLDDETRAEYQRRLAEEMKLIKDKGFADYFLVVQDFIRYARSREIPVGPGRGSAAGSLVSWAMRITDIDPIRFGLFFERFLNPERQDNPDMDIDFCAHGRDEVIRYVSEHYGADKVAQIATFGTLGAKAVIRDVGRAMGIPYSDVDVIAKLVPDELGITLDRAVESEPKLRDAVAEKSWVAELMEYGRSLEGLTRHASTHAAGVVISNEPLIDLLPLMCDQRGEVVTQFDKDDVEKVGLVKFDFLGLKTLTVIDLALKNLRSKGIEIDLSRVELDDAKAFELLCQARTSGVFQLESSGMKDLLIKFKPSSIEDIIALIALYRPGPMQMIDQFIRQKHGLEKPHYIVPEMEEVLSETHGIMIYQEQVMRLASMIGGLSLGDADLLRRAMSKKKMDKMISYREKFISGAKSKGIGVQQATEVWELMERFAEYGFNKSHSAAYAILAFQTAYLKAHYPAQFMAALMTMEAGDSDKILQRIMECRSDMGLTVLGPDVNESFEDFSVTAVGEIRFGLAAVKNVGRGAVEAVIEARERLEVFKGLFQFCREVDLGRVNRRVVESLVKGGAFDFTQIHRARLLEGVDRALDSGSKEQLDRKRGQMGLFAGDSGLVPEQNDATLLHDVPPWSNKTLLDEEKEALGYYLTGHPLMEHERLLKLLATHDTAALRELRAKGEIRIAGIVNSVRQRVNKRGERWAITVLEDLVGTCEMLVFSDVYKRSEELLGAGLPLLIKGQADVGDKGTSIKVSEVIELSRAAEQLFKQVHFSLSSSGLTREQLEQLRLLCMRHPGQAEGYLRLRLPEGVQAMIRFSDDLKIKPCQELVTEAQKLLGYDSVELMTSDAVWRRE
ncbi:MAG: DNA polymerase III subunit alpha [Candidatus Alcyoniella australis]|nr:DNA polymerase III subunit alpha [Candidatus Alcyoniella australis]